MQAEEQKQMESQAKKVEATPMLIPVSQLWERLTLEHRRRLLQVLVTICAELLSAPPLPPQKEAPHE